MLAALALGALVSTSRVVHAQSAPHEYRSEILVYSPTLGGFSAFLVGEDHLDVAGLNTTERQRGAGVSYTISHELSAQVDFRYMNGRDGYMEHRWDPAVIAHVQLPADFELTSRTRDAIRDVRRSTGPEWSSRLEERLTLSRAERIAGFAFTPFVSMQPSYDTRYHTVNKYEELAGARFPRGPVTTEIFGEWWQDSRGGTRRYGSVSLLFRVTT